MAFNRHWINNPNSIWRTWQLASLKFLCHRNGNEVTQIGWVVRSLLNLPLSRYSIRLGKKLSILFVCNSSSTTSSHLHLGRKWGHIHLTHSDARVCDWTEYRPSDLELQLAKINVGSTDLLNYFWYTKFLAPIDNPVIHILASTHPFGKSSIYQTHLYIYPSSSSNRFDASG